MCTYWPVTPQLHERVDASPRIEEVLDGLLDLSRLDAGGLRHTAEDIDAVRQGGESTSP
ncbi:hypothetical protein [Xanthomonas vasicola]|uniref:hypothetical protein n=1 Tax=Xanthomonas vasicola TaxID=56459 RepID=UPI0001CBF9F4